MFKSCRTPALAAAALASVVAGCTAWSVVTAPTPVTIATGSPGGIYHPVGNAICRLYNLARTGDEGACVAVSSDGAVANIERVRRSESTVGLSQSDIAYAAYHGEGPFAAAGPDTELRTLIALQRESFTIVARADSNIRNFQELRGKRIGLGKSGAGYGVTRDVVLGFYGWTISDFDRTLELGPAEQNQTLCDGRVDAIIFEAAHPNGLTQEATADCRARLVPIVGPPIDRLLATHPYYVASFIPGGLYDGNPKDIPTFGTPDLLVTSARQPDQVAYAMVKAVIENFADFHRLHPALSTLTLKDMVPSDAIVPLHPGALRYYREVGLIH